LSGHPRRFVVLSDHERKTLREVERQLMAEDPEFPRRFDRVGQRHPTYSLHWAYAMPRWAYTTAIVAAVTLSVLMMMVRAPGAALVFAALATIIAVVRKCRDKPARREP
jgi:hypothetical protein